MPEKKKHTYFSPATGDNPDGVSFAKKAEAPSALVKFITVFLGTVILLDLPVFLIFLSDSKIEDIPKIVFSFMIIIPTGMGIAGIFFLQRMMDGLRKSGTFLFEVFFDGITR